jgi:hypothetical protein
MAVRAEAKIPGGSQLGRLPAEAGLKPLRAAAGAF